MSESVENYEQAIEYLFGRINYERLSSTAYSASDFKLDRMRELLHRLGDPQERISAVHITGTKGKGSTAALVSAVLSAAGYRTGLFTSPHISAFEERMAVDGVLPSPAQIVDLVNRVAAVVAELDLLPGPMSPTYFEITTAMAWLYFAQQGAQVVVLEVGLGGRLDATNVCRPEVTVITTISRDHTKLLGTRRDQIAREKAGIAKPGVPMVCGVLDAPVQQVIAEACAEQGAPLLQLEHDFGYRVQAVGHAATPGGDEIEVWLPGGRRLAATVPLIGAHQAHNGAVALAVIDQLERRGWLIPENAVHAGWQRLHWPARIEVMGRRPTVIVDAAHNWAAITALLGTLDQRFAARRRILVFAGTKDKDVSGMLRQLLPRFDTVILTACQNNPRGATVESLGRMVRGICATSVHLTPDPVAAWKLARRFAGPEDLICVTGSFFLTAELRDLIADDSRTGTGAATASCGRGS